MSARASFAAISPSESKEMYGEGMSIEEIADRTGRSYTYIRNRLLDADTLLRSKASGTTLYISRHPEWTRQFIKCEVANPLALTYDKLLLLTMVTTEGYTDSTSFGFTNTQEFLHRRYRELVRAVYGSVLIGRNRITSRTSSTEIAHDISSLIPGKAFGERALKAIQASPTLVADVLRIVADTEGSMLISIRKAPRNYKVECRVVLASSNALFTRQLVKLLTSLDITSKPTSLGASIGTKAGISRFMSIVGFSAQARVIRKKGNESVWFGYKKSGLAKLFKRINQEQSLARLSGMRGCFADCATRSQIILRLKKWYEESNGGDVS